MNTITNSYKEMSQILNEHNSYWAKNDIWKINDLKKFNIEIKKEVSWAFADFSIYKKSSIKLEIKYYIFSCLSNKICSPESIMSNYKKAIYDIGIISNNLRNKSLLDINIDSIDTTQYSTSRYNAIIKLLKKTCIYIQDRYDNRPEYQKDIWNVSKIKGAHLSSIDYHQQQYLYFNGFPKYYRETVKSYFSRMILTHSFSYCLDNFMYLKKFFNYFYNSGYSDGFLKKLTRNDVVAYYNWIQNNFYHQEKTVLTRYITYPRRFLNYIKLSGDSKAPSSEINKLILDFDIPRRSHNASYSESNKYIPAPIIKQIDDCIDEIEPDIYLPVYILLRESGWRGADIFNLRYDNCLDYVWHEASKKYVPFLCGKITKTNISCLRIPIRDEIADLLKQLISQAKAQSNETNNPNKFLFNTYMGKYMGKPYSKTSFVNAIQNLIDRKQIYDTNGKPYHFKTHALRHTRAVEYVEHGMPIAVIKEILGHCSVDMTLHYAKITDNTMYNKWKETENLIDFENKTVTEKVQNLTAKSNHCKAIDNPNIDIVKIPFGKCVKSSLIPCKNIVDRCLNCQNFCADENDLEDIIIEIEKLETIIENNHNQGHDNWAKINKEYLQRLEKIKNSIICTNKM